MTLITPVLLAGGYGTRLWPTSRKGYPKQFSKLLGDETLFQSSAKRLVSSQTVQFDAPITMTNSDFRFIVVEQLQRAGVDPGAVLIEPEGRNTAPAVLAAAIYASNRNPDANILIAPSDHIIPDTLAFHAAICKGVKETANGRIVTFGITPTRPETGYGYLELSAPSSGCAVPLKRFVEKPDLASAKAMLDAGTYLWNAGIFLFRAKDMIAAFKALAPELIGPVSDAIEQGHADLGFFRLAAAPWTKCQNISIDYAIMEKINTLSAVPYSAGWNDLGEWDSVWLELGPNAEGVVTSENATAIECQDVLLRSENESQHLVGLGLENIIAIAMPDAVLVAHKSRAQDIKLVVSTLKTNGVPQAETFPKDHRPWGWFESLIIGGRFQVKRIHVLAGAALSLQSHHHRSEHWIVVEGTAKVTVDDNVTLLTEGQSTYIPLGAVHRMENPGKVPMVLIEVQTGVYLGEDDIKRYKDNYART
ncbi:MAG: mannose-1-phosphate guanylyltransferase/mannose-6-phosphate isomerase [Paracoccaceae bacterium]|nr:mannose-1-phosphate guanylyltransferase/mannose-6-phosphate isomerase [Paracoccaceae bacterium]MDG1316821.1 mannose-1-phosphate guanylyltransferase/mannose-6-phosphate isomerase [Paracoccaceae bacterium]|tara:strand:+ start:2296 stop:3723 length:1428 start_codon:yes stop_codon:yes gene_type:complete